MIDQDIVCFPNNVCSMLESGLQTIDADLRIAWVNDVAARIGGYAVDAHLGKRLSELHPQTAVQAEPALAAAGAHGRVEPVAVQAHTPGQTLLARVAAAQIQCHAHGERLGQAQAGAAQFIHRARHHQVDQAARRAGAVVGFHILILAEDVEVWLAFEEFEVYQRDVKKDPKAGLDIVDQIMLLSGFLK